MDIDMDFANGTGRPMLDICDFGDNVVVDSQFFANSCNEDDDDHEDKMLS